ncbi:MAG TPA: PmoA family protein, partial [Candidatus Hydrogenedentes bacterium]|nr:PmoA family protein [Candidatus Hydrogenedentota bacterium]
EGAADLDGVLVVREGTTGKLFPVTLRDGELVFVSEGAMPKTAHEYTVEIEPDAKGEHVDKVLIKQKADEPVVEVYIEDVLFTAYHFSNDNKKPFLWPVNAEGGVSVTRDYPMAPIAIKMAEDHPHHKSVWSAYGDLRLAGGEGVDCWAEGGNSGFQRSGEVTWGSGDAYGWIRADNVWEDKDHKPVVREQREYRFYATPARARLFDVAVTFTAEYGDVLFKDTKEGGIVSARMRPELSYRNAVITNAHGDQGEARCWGKPSPWCDFSGEMPDRGWLGLTVFDHPGNMRHPTSWHVRQYGLMGANCFGYSYFNEKPYNKGLIPENGDFELKQGEGVTLRYRVYVHNGDVKGARVADRYADYATPPDARWID